MKKKPKNIINNTSNIFIIDLVMVEFLDDLGCNLGCIVNKIYLNLRIKTNL